MGWTAYHVDGIWKDSRYVIDRKEECNRIISQEAHQSQGIWYPEIKVLKSAIVGRVYYAAVKTTNKDGSYKIWAAVFLTRTNQSSYNNFAYKDQDETCGPTDCRCPQGILNLLTETDSQFAKAWRERCWDYHEMKKEPQLLSNLPVGSKISFICQSPMNNGIKAGDKILLTKVLKPGKKRGLHYWTDGKYRWSKKLIPSEFEVVA